MSEYDCEWKKYYSIHKFWITKDVLACRQWQAVIVFACHFLKLPEQVEGNISTPEGFTHNPVPQIEITDQYKASLGYPAHNSGNSKWKVVIKTKKIPNKTDRLLYWNMPVNNFNHFWVINYWWVSKLGQECMGECHGQATHVFECYLPRVQISSSPTFRRVIAIYSVQYLYM